MQQVESTLFNVPHDPVQRTGKFDYELCYLLRKQETVDDLEEWMKQILQKRREGDENYGTEVDSTRFNKLMEAVEVRVEGRRSAAD